MFNTTIVGKTTHEYVPYTKTVHHHKAPTDASIRLLNEFKEKILKETMAIYEVKDSPVNAVIRYCEDPATLNRYAAVKFSINGQECVEKVVFKEMLLSRGAVNEDLLKQYKQLIVDVVTKALANSVLYQLLNKE